MKLIILDRDGVINEDSDEYIKSPQEWHPIPGSLEAIALLNQLGYTVSVATNQSGIARGYYSLETLMQIHQKMHNSVNALGGNIDSIFYCPHGPDDNCDCRKPKPGLLHQINSHYGISLENVPVIGDSWRDLQAAIAVKAKPFLVLTGKGLKTQQTHQDSLTKEHIRVFADLLSFANTIHSLV
ncbi:MAG: D-glycero-beta-D-manno-heptose 1,7-bisphosphate 7-phosphatase [Candidatus Berkiella sp.]